MSPVTKLSPRMSLPLQPFSIKMALVMIQVLDMSVYGNILSNLLVIYYLNAMITCYSFAIFWAFPLISILFFFNVSVNDLSCKTILCESVP